MKKLFVYLFSFLVLLFGCTSSSKYLERAQFDAAVNKSVTKLRKKSTNGKELNVLKQSFGKANQADLERINFLKASGEPDIWDNVFSLYSTLKLRQSIVKTLPANVLNKINFVPVDYDQEVISAKKKAAEYFYTHAIILLNKKDRQSARTAYTDLQKVKQYYNDYKDTDSKMQEALSAGTNNILFKMKNQTKLILPKTFEEELLKISMSDLNTLWLNYDTKADESLYYDYSIVLNVNNILVSPEQVKEESYTDQKEIQDGFKYKLDSKGNVMKDSSGNDIKIPIIKIITCKVVMVHQLKTATITGTLDYLNNRTGKLIKTNPITTETIFENHSATPYGDINALSEKSKKIMGNKFIPFPSDPDLILQTGMKLKDMTKNIIWDNKNLIQY